MRLRILLNAGAAVGALAWLGLGLADPAAAQSRDESPSTVDDIVVTAQKREQSLQDVPIVITALSQETLSNAGVRDIKDLQILTPGLNVASTGGEASTTVRIRGVGTVGDNPGLESSVSVVIDGVYRPRNGVAMGDLGELQRIEVLKGPQGTLFGKNTSAGVINVLTAAPSFTFGGQAELTAGAYDALGASLSLTGPLIADRLAGRLYVATRERDGFYSVSTGAGPRTETKDASQDFYTVRGQLLFTPTDTLDVRIIADYTRRDEFCCAGVQIISSGTAALIDALAPDSGVARPAAPFDRRAWLNRDTIQNIEDKGVSAEINWQTPWLGDAVLTSITATRSWFSNGSADLDYSSADIWQRPYGSYSAGFDQFSQELRLAGATDRLEWQIGAFYADEDLASQTPVIFGAAYETYFGLLLSAGAAPGLVSVLTGLPAGTSFTPGSGQLDTFAQTSRSVALFTNETLSVTDRLKLTMGLRWTQEKKSLDSHYTNLPGNNGCGAALGRLPAIAAIVGAAATPTVVGNLCLPWTDPAFTNLTTRQDRDEDQVTGTAKIGYDFTDTVMGYASYARGYKAGGFNLDRARSSIGVAQTDTSFAEETVDSYEVGLKSSLFDRSLSLNGAWFHQRFEGFQLNAFTGVSYIVSSIPEVTSEGLDLDALWFTPITGLSLQGGLTYADTRYGDFVPVTGVSPRLPGARLSFAPEWSGSLSANYERPLDGGVTLRLSLAAKYSSEYNTGSDLAPQKMQEAFTVVNGRIGLTGQDDRWTAELWAQNLFDEDYYQVAFDAPLQSGGFNAFLGAPRTWGVTVRNRF
ncbi:Vitamin B12 transporter BtuB [Brevundimonas sp. NIBR10]|uniref:TonB-dependent receptor n=1 Tax=Brevundimonas sp. NIBR10 TaxID=3015997 RepID=UPI0022F1AB79|nr:TonB-dependent receptor [Brevundimonas sp. NIBR10]WGM45941.1 Vitamin B12 transporter BtuB [Brevundimonas sp. NIBR10]